MIKNFIPYYKPHKKLFFLDMGAAIILAVTNLVYPMITRQFINQYVPNQNMKMVVATIAILFGIYLLQYFCQHFVQYWGHVMGVRMQCDIRREAFQHLQRLPFSFFDQSRSGTILSRVINDTMDIAEFAHHGPEELLISTIQFIGAFIILSRINLKLTLIIFAMVPILAVFAIKKRVDLSRTTMETRVQIGEVNADLENSIAGVRVSKSYGSQAHDLHKFQHGNQAFCDAASIRYRTMADFYSGTDFIINMFTLVSLLFSGIFALNGSITIGDFTAFLLFVGTFSQPIRGFTVLIDTLQSGATGFQRVKELLDAPVEEDAPDAKELTHVKGDIEFEDISFRYDKGKERVFHNLNLSVKAGQTTALVGPSGGGKSTLCHLLPRFYDIDHGRILLDGVDIDDYTRFSLRQNIGLVQQDTFLFTGTIKDNIAYGNFDATDEDIVKAAKSANIHEFVSNLPDGYDTFVGERGVMLSGGQKQRISIARIFLKNPPILILDEATSALDNTTEKAIQESLNQLSTGRTTFVVAHRLSTIRNADQIAYIADDKIQELGTHEELLEKDGLYAELWKAQLSTTN